MTKWIVAFFNNQSCVVVAFLALTVIFFGVVSGCIPFQREPEETLEVGLQPTEGFCKDWSLIEQEIKGQTLCSQRRLINGYNIMCTRKLGHEGPHHMHGKRDCYWVW